MTGKAVLFEVLEKITPPQILDETAVYSTDDGSNGWVAFLLVYFCERSIFY